MTHKTTVRAVMMTEKTSSVADELLTAAEAMARLNVSRSTLERYEAAGRLAPLRLPSGHRRFRRVEIDALLSNAS